MKKDDKKSGCFAISNAVLFFSAAILVMVSAASIADSESAEPTKENSLKSDGYHFSTKNDLTTMIFSSIDTSDVHLRDVVCEIKDTMKCVGIVNEKKSVCEGPLSHSDVKESGALGILIYGISGPLIVISCFE